MKAAVSCGGTGGHVFPGLAVAECLRARGHDVTVWLSGKSVESDTIGGWTGRIQTVRSEGFSAGVSLSWVGAALRLLGAAAASRKRMAQDRPDVLLAMGSYASVGPALAARSLGVPVVLHEANAVPGRAVSALSRLAAAVGVAFEDAAQFFQSVRVVHTGLPLRTGLDARFEPGFLEAGTMTVLVMGGSQGAQRLNEVCPRAAGIVRRSGIPVQAIHLSGARDRDRVQDAYREEGVPCRVFSFLAEVGKAYHAADLAVARAGAATCAELCTCGVPALLVPLPAARRDHQTANARALARGGGADVMPQGRLTPEALASYIAARAQAPDGLRARAAAMRRMAVPDATERLSSLVEEIARAR